jgi:hypothetical protein
LSTSRLDEALGALEVREENARKEAERIAAEAAAEAEANASEEKRKAHERGVELARLEPETEGRVDQLAADPVLDSELMKPPGAEVDLLGSCLERIAEQRPDGR